MSNAMIRSKLQRVNKKRNKKDNISDKNDNLSSLIPEAFKNKCIKKTIVGFSSGSCRFTRIKDYTIGPGENNYF